MANIYNSVLHTYEDADAWLGHRSERTPPTRKSNTVLYRTTRESDGIAGIGVRYYRTTVITLWADGFVTISPQGWSNAYTSRRIDQYLPLTWGISLNRRKPGLFYKGIRFPLVEDVPIHLDTYHQMTEREMEVFFRLLEDGTEPETAHGIAKVI